MKKRYCRDTVLFGISLTLVCLSLLIGQDRFLSLKGKYFGQKEPGEKAAIFAPGLISIPGRYDLALNFSPDGRELLFSAQVPGDQMRVFHSRLSKGKWTIPNPVSLSQGAKKEEMEAFFSPDGKYIYFAPYDKGMDVRIWSLRRSASGWQNPRPLGPPVSEDPSFYPTCTLSGSVYYSNLAKRKVYRAVLEEGHVVNAEYSGIALGGHPFVSPDESFVLVDSTLEENPEQRDIFVTFRRKDGTWTSPLDLGPEVNTDFFETCPSLSHDGRYIFFSRYNEPGQIANIYWIKSTILIPLKKQALK